MATLTFARLLIFLCNYYTANFFLLHCICIIPKKLHLFDTFLHVWYLTNQIQLLLSSCDGMLAVTFSVWQTVVCGHCQCR